MVLHNASCLASGLDITDSQNAFQALATDIKDVLDSSMTSRPLCAVSGRCSKCRPPDKEVEIGVRNDAEGSSENPVSHGVKVLVKILKDMEQNMPLLLHGTGNLNISDQHWEWTKFPAGFLPWEHAALLCDVYRDSTSLHFENDK